MQVLWRSEETCDIFMGNPVSFMPENGSGDGIYFSLKEIGLILTLSALAALTGALVPSVLFPGGPTF